MTGQGTAHGHERPEFSRRLDLLVIADLVAPGSRVLDVGCGDGDLLALLKKERGVEGRGIELSQSGVNRSLARGLSVIQGDADTDLVDYPDDSFDFVILSDTIQAMVRPKAVLSEMLRIGKKAIVSFPNFGHWTVRASLGFKGRMPVTENLPYSWYDTPNIHFCTIRDFATLCAEIDAHIERPVVLDAGGGHLAPRAPWWFRNLFGQQAVFLLSRGR